MLETDVIVRKRGLVDVDRRTGEEPLSVDTIGDPRYVWVTTGVIEAGEEKTVFLTRSRTAGGENLFTKIPGAQAWKRSTSGNLVRGYGPVNPQDNLVLEGVSPADLKLKWFGANRVWGVVVTNSGSDDRDFAVRLEGV